MRIYRDKRDFEHLCIMYRKFCPWPQTLGIPDSLNWIDPRRLDSRDETLLQYIDIL